MVNRKKCFFPWCKNREETGKIFVTVPRAPKERRCQWLSLAGIEQNNNSYFCCEHHFVLEEDVENWQYCKFSSGPIKIKKDVLPHVGLKNPRDFPFPSQRKKLLEIRASLNNWLVDEKSTIPSTSSSQVSQNVNAAITSSSTEESALTRAPLTSSALVQRRHYRKGDSSSESSDQPGFLTSKVVVNVGQDQVPVKRYYGVLDGANFFLETDPADETPANSSHQEEASDDVVLVSPSDLLRNDYESDGQEYQSTVENSHSEKSQNGAYSKTKIDKVQNHTPNRIEKTPFKRNHTFLEEDDPEDDFTAFGKFVASEMRQMRSDERKKRLKRSILRSILDACEEDDLEYSISFSPICDKPKTEPALISTENKL